METTIIQKQIYEGTNNIKNKDVYVISPRFRLSNERTYIRMYGHSSIGDYHLHHSVGIVLALCNGKRSVGDIARIVVPFVEDSEGNNPLEEATLTVKKIITFYLKSEEEQKGGQDAYKEFPSNAALIPASLLSEFGALRPPQYDAKSFLPEYSPEAPGIKYAHKERVPNHINWHLTSACSVDCVYCYLKRRKIQKSNMLPFERMRELLKEAKEIGVFHVEPGGGDVLLYPNLFEFLDIIEEYEFLPVRVCTKAYCSKETAHRLAKYSVLPIIQFSIDSTVPGVADYLTHSRGFCDRILESIENALKAGLCVATKTVITPYNILTVPTLYRELRARGVKQVILAAYNMSGFHHTDDLFNHIETYKWLEQEVEILKKEFPNDFINVQNGGPGTGPSTKEDLKEAWKNKSRCTAGRTNMMVCADGKVIPCEQMPEIEENFCGDLTTQSIEEVWNSKELAERTTAMPHGKFKGTPCYDCEDFEHCVNHNGYCIRDTSQYFGTIYTTPSNCPKCEQSWLRTV